MKKREQEIDHLLDEYFIYDPNIGKVYNKITRSSRAIKDDESGSIDNNGYLKTRFKKNEYTIHRLAWRLYYGEWPKKSLDHINGIKSDNRIVNLRECDHRTNAQNTHRHRNGKLCGYWFDKKRNKIKSEIRIKNRVYHLGYHLNENEAYELYLKACKAIKIKEFKTAKELREYLKSAAGQSFDILKDPNL